MVEFVRLVADASRKAHDGALRPHNAQAVAELQMDAAVGKEFHAGAEKARNVEAVVVRQVQIADLEAVHLGVGDEHGFGVDRRVLNLQVNAERLFAEESDDAGFVFALRDDTEDVALKDFRIGAGTADWAAGRLNAGADKRTVDELTNRLNRLAVEKVVDDFNIKGAGGFIFVRFVGFPGFVFFCEIHAEDDADNDGRNNDADDAERIGAGISHRNVRSLPAHNGERLLRGTQAGGVGDGAKMHAEHRRQVNQARCECPEQNRHQDGEHNGTGSKPIEDDAARLKTRKKRRADLQADEENEKYQTKVAQEG